MNANHRWHLVVLLTSLLFGATPGLAQNQLQAPAVEDILKKPIDNSFFHLPVDDRLGAQIDQLIVDLTAPEYDKRTAAKEQLISIGASAYAKLKAAYRASDDLELRLNVEEVVKASYMSQLIFSKTGFLGMQQARTRPPTHADDPRIAEGSTGIVIGRVLPNTGAERAGLQADDVIIGLDGLPLEGDATQVFANFSAKIRTTGPGGQLHLTILRPNDGVFDLTATLGPVPRSSYASTNGMREIVPVVSDRFDIWWRRYFVGDETEPVRPPD